VPTFKGFVRGAEVESLRFAGANKARLDEMVAALEAKPLPQAS
jgi:hypothetical protein